MPKPDIPENIDIDGGAPDIMVIICTNFLFREIFYEWYIPISTVAGVIMTAKTGTIQQ